MAKWRFLSPEWIAAARQIHAENAEVAAAAFAIRMNLVVTEVPFDPGELEAHLDSSGAGIEIDLGHLADPDVKVSLDYETAKAILVDGNQETGLQAFLSGKILVEGDITKLLAFQSAPAAVGESKATALLQEITE